MFHFHYSHIKCMTIDICTEHQHLQQLAVTVTLLRLSFWWKYKWICLKINSNLYGNGKFVLKLWLSIHTARSIVSVFNNSNGFFCGICNTYLLYETIQLIHRLTKFTRKQNITIVLPYASHKSNSLKHQWSLDTTIYTKKHVPPIRRS